MSFSVMGEETGEGGGRDGEVEEMKEESLLSERDGCKTEVTKTVFL